MARKPKKEDQRELRTPRKDNGPIDQAVHELTAKLEDLTRKLIVQADKFGTSVGNLDLSGRMRPFIDQVGNLVVEHDRMTQQLGNTIAHLQEEDLVLSEEISAIARDFVTRVVNFRSAVDNIEDYEKELRQLIGAPGTQGPNFDSLVDVYMAQLDGLGPIITQFAVKVQACEPCMDIEKYETLIKSYEDILANWAGLLKSLEDLLNSKRAMLYNLEKEREELLKSYEELTKSAIEVEEKRLDLQNKPLRKRLEFAKSFEELAKSAMELVKALKELITLPEKNTEDLLKSYAEIATMIEELLKSMFALRAVSSGRVPLNATSSADEAFSFRDHMP